MSYQELYEKSVSPNKRAADKKNLYDYPQLAVQKFGRIPENAYLCTKFEIPLQDEAI